MNKKNIARTTWITCIFLSLITILIAVIDYKVHYEFLTKNKLYFYECTGNLCVTEVEDNDNLLYSSYDCNLNNCPIYKKELDDNHVLFQENDKIVLYNYRLGKVISKDYDDYQILNNNYIIITKNQKQGIIDNNNKIILEPIYEEIGYKENNYITGYDLNQIIVKNNNQYGIINFRTREIIEDFKYTENEINILLKKLEENN